MTQPVFDVCVIGGGPAGSATALLLAKAGMQVLLLEASDYSRVRRTETLTPRIHHALENAGLFQSFVKEQHAPVAGIASVWGTKDIRVNDFFGGLDGPGWQIERPAFERTLALAARDAKATIYLGACMLRPPTLKRAKWHFEVGVQGTTTFPCSSYFLVDATGRSGTPWLCGLTPKIALDKLISIVWRGQQSHESPYILVEAIEDGWFYLANVPNSQSICIFSTDSDIFREHPTTVSQFWLKRLRKSNHVQSLISSSVDPRVLKVVSSATIMRREPIGKGWCAVGDAIFSHDPLSGEGVNHALQSALEATRAIIKHVGNGTPLHAYKQAAERRFTAYLSARTFHYSPETRWPHSLFWQRRSFYAHPPKSTESVSTTRFLP